MLEHDNQQREEEAAKLPKSIVVQSHRKEKIRISTASSKWNWYLARRCCQCLIYNICIFPMSREILWFSLRSAASAVNLCPDLCRVEFLRFWFEILQMSRYRFNDTQYLFLEKSEKQNGHQGAFYGKKFRPNFFVKIHFSPFQTKKKILFPKKISIKKLFLFFVLEKKFAWVLWNFSGGKMSQ